MASTRLLVIGCPEGTPAAPRAGKFLQLSIAGEPVLVFACAEAHQYHSQILSAFVATTGVPHHWEGEALLVVDDPTVTVGGGGRFRADPAARILDLWDDSKAYGRFQEEGIAAQVASAAHPWSGFRVRVG
jgi:hypothetical protein